jgi:hypothetical protein
MWENYICKEPTNVSFLILCLKATGETNKEPINEVHSIILGKPVSG